MRRCQSLICRLVLVACASAPAGALAFDFSAGKDFAGYWNNTLAAGVTLRGTNADYQLIGSANSNQYPGSFGAVTVNDDSNLNYPHAGNVVAAPLTLVSELNLLFQGRYGAFVRLRGWYDIALENTGVPHGNVPNGYTPGASLSDSGFRMANRFFGAQITDAFLQGSFALGDVGMFLRLGRQTVNWGQGQLYPGINSFNPLDVSWLLRPGGGVLDDGFLPLTRLYMSFQFPGGLTLDGFYNFEWASSNLPACGEWGSFLDTAFDAGCNKATPAIGVPDREVLQKGLAINSLNNISASTWNQFGLAARYFLEPIATQFALYYVRFNSVNPVVNISHGASPSAIEVASVYPGGVQELALSISSGIRNFTFYGELLTTFGQPFQRNFPSLIQGAVNAQGPYAAGIQSTPVGSFFPGYVKLDPIQFLFGGTVQLPSVVGLSQMLLTVEGNLQGTPSFPSTNVERLFRNGNFGTATYNGSCQGGDNVCAVDGFATPWVFGYRLRLQATTYFAGTTIALTPVVSFSHDVVGYSADGTMVQGRVSGSLALRLSYRQMAFVQASGTWFRLDTPYDFLRDRGVYNFSVGATF